MILGNSNHPVEVKKISVRIWKLRDEIESVYAKTVDGKKEEEVSDKLKDIEKKYAFLSKPPAQVIPLTDAVSAPAAEKTEEEGEEENAGDETDEENNEEENNEEEKTEEEPDKEASKEDAENADEGDNSEEDEEAKEKAADAKPEVDSTGNPKLPANVVEIHQRPVITEDKVSNGVCFLTDIDMFYVHFFSETNFIEGQTIVIEFLVPAKFNLIAEVTRSVVYNLKSRIISSSRPPFRLSAKFRAERPGDRQILRKFLTAIQPEIPAPTKKKVAVQEDEDDFDDLDLD